MGDFNPAAFTYDAQFTFSIVGQAQRKLVWHHIYKMRLEPYHTVLEINCGTGEDAYRWSKLNKFITGTDISPKMIEVAKTKFPGISFEGLDIRKINTYQRKYDLLFSNFGGLNCLSPEEIRRFFENVYTQLPQSGRLILVIMGKKCVWDRLFLILKRKWKLRNRRNTINNVEVHVNGSMVNTWYYSPREIQQFTNNKYTVERAYPIGLFVPPSYLSSYFSNKKSWMKLLEFLDRLFSFRFLANYADHYLIVLKKN